MQCPAGTGREGCLVIVRAGGDLGVELWVLQLLQREGCWGKEIGWQRKVRNVLPKDWAPSQMLMTVASGNQRLCERQPHRHPKEVWGLVGVGEVRETGKVRGTDRLEKSTCSPRVLPPFRSKLSGRNCGCHHSNRSS